MTRKTVKQTSLKAKPKTIEAGNAFGFKSATNSSTPSSSFIPIPPVLQELPLNLLNNNNSSFKSFPQKKRNIDMLVDVPVANDFNLFEETIDTARILDPQVVVASSSKDSGSDTKRIKLVSTDNPKQEKKFASKTFDKTKHMAIKSTRERAVSQEGIKSWTCDLFSLVLFNYIGVTKELALKEIKGCAKTFSLRTAFIIDPEDPAKLIPRKMTATDRSELIEVLTKERMPIYDEGVSLALVKNLLDPTKWIRYSATRWVCLTVGEVMNEKFKLLGNVTDGKIQIWTPGGNLQRAHIVLLAAGKARPEATEVGKEWTADHINSNEKRNDSLSNLRWADKSTQRKNQGSRSFTETFDTPTGNLLSQHPTHEGLEITSDGFFRQNGVLKWTKGADQLSGQRQVNIKGKIYHVHVLMVECILGRPLTKEESVDHINGVRDNILSNLSPLLKCDNTMKSQVKLVTRIDKEGNAVIFGGINLAVDATKGADKGGVSHCFSGRHRRNAGFFWKDSSKEEIDRFFAEMSMIDKTKLAFPELANNPLNSQETYARYENLLRSIAKAKEWEAAKTRFVANLAQLSQTIFSL